MHYNLDAIESNKVDFLIDRGLDEIKLSELVEHEPKLWGPARDATL